MDQSSTASGDGNIIFMIQKSLVYNPIKSNPRVLSQTIFKKEKKKEKKTLPKHLIIKVQ